MQETYRSHRSQGGGQPLLHMIYIYMVDTPKETNGDEATEDNPSRKKAKHGRRPRRSKPRQGNTGTEDDNNPDGADNEYNPEQPAFEQAKQEEGHDSPDEQATDG